MKRKKGVSSPSPLVSASVIPNLELSSPVNFTNQHSRQTEELLGRWAPFMLLITVFEEYSVFLGVGATLLARSLYLLGIIQAKAVGKRVVRPELW